LSVYLDTSVLTAYFIPEVGSPKVQEYLSKQYSVAISGLTRVEFASSIKSRYLSTDPIYKIAKQDAIKVLNQFNSQIQSGYYNLLAIFIEDYKNTEEFLSDLDNEVSIRAADAIHIAIAMREGLTLATADDQQARASKALGVKTDFLKYPR
jgi:uncharacterized protein